MKREQDERFVAVEREGRKISLKQSTTNITHQHHQNKHGRKHSSNTPTIQSFLTFPSSSTSSALCSSSFPLLFLSLFYKRWFFPTRYPRPNIPPLPTLLPSLTSHSAATSPARSPLPASPPTLHFPSCPFPF